MVPQIPAAARWSRRSVLRGVAAGATLGGATALTGCSSPVDVRSKRLVLTVADSPSVQSTPSNDEYRLQEGGVHWDAPPVETVVGTSTAPNELDTEAVERAVEAAMGAWNGVPEARRVFESPTFDDSLLTVTQGNRTNELVWASLDASEIGEATIYWDGATDHLLEVNVRLNSELAWSTAPDVTAGREYDLQSILAHELGHHGLDDVTAADAAEQTMYGYTDEERTRKRTLAADDVAGWQAAYGSS